MGTSGFGRPDEVVAGRTSLVEVGFRNLSGRRVAESEVGPWAAPKRKRWDARPFKERIAERAARTLAEDVRRTRVMVESDEG